MSNSIYSINIHNISKCDNVAAFYTKLFKISRFITMGLIDESEPPQLRIWIVIDSDLFVPTNPGLYMNSPFLHRYFNNPNRTSENAMYCDPNKLFYIYWKKLHSNHREIRHKYQHIYG